MKEEILKLYEQYKEEDKKYSQLADQKSSSIILNEQIEIINKIRRKIATLLDNKIMELPNGSYLEFDGYQDELYEVEELI